MIDTQRMRVRNTDFGGTVAPTNAKELADATDVAKGVVFEHIRHVMRGAGERSGFQTSTAYRLMLVSEKILAKDWDTPEEKEAWAYLSRGK